jgi:hypothetical protein
VSNRKKAINIKRIQRSLATAEKLVERMVDVRAPEVAVVATENPIPRWDEDTKQVVSEVLLMDGIEWRGGRNQIPIVDSHNDKTVRNIFGSIQGLQTEGTELFGKPVFASDEESQVIAMRMAEGHITDFSITAVPLETIYVKRGDSYTTTNGNVIQGPALIHTRWQPHNASICATGADELSTVRRSYTVDLKRKVTRMDEALMAQCQSMGCPAEITDPNQILAWMLGKLAEDKDESPEPIEMMAEEPEKESPVVPGEEVKLGYGEKLEKMAAPEDPELTKRSVEQIKGLIKRSIEQGRSQEAVRRNEIQAAVKLAKLESSFADELCNSTLSAADAKQRIIERMATQPLGSSVGADVHVTESGDDKFHNAVLDGIVMRSARSAGIRRSIFVGGDKPSEGAADFAKLNLKRLAYSCCNRLGAPVERMSDTEICQLAMGNKTVARKYRVERSDYSAYHTTGSFSNILLDAANKNLLASYEEAPFTWNLWARTGTPAEDLKTLNRTRFSEAPNPEEVPEGKDYPEKPMSDSRESYRVAKFGESFTVSWETIINDDLDAISRVPAMHGNAMRRLQNRKVYEVLTSNPTMGDGFALFSASHASGDNTSGAAAAPGVSTLNAAFVKMMTQKGLTSDAILNIVPRYLIVPVAYSATALELVNSTSYVLANSNQGVQNIYGPGGTRPLTVVVDPQLDANSATNWYLAADPSQIDTVELTFLSGEESPVMESEWNMKNDTYLYKIRQTFGVKAIDWRGLFRNA